MAGDKDEQGKKAAKKKPVKAKPESLETLFRADPAKNKARR